MLLISAICGVVRWGIMGATTALPWLIVVQILHCGTFTVCHLAAMRYIAARQGSEVIRLQAVYSAVAMGGSIAIMTVFAGSLAPIVKAWFAQENSQPNIVQVATNILVTMNLVGMGLGVTLIPGYMNNFNTGQVVFRPIAGNVPSIALLMAWKKGEMKPALRDFIAIVQERLASVTA